MKEYFTTVNRYIRNTHPAQTAGASFTYGGRAGLARSKSVKLLDITSNVKTHHHTS